MDMQGSTGGFLPEKEAVVPDRQQLDVILEQAETEKVAELMSVGDNAGRFNLKHQSLIRPALRPVTLGNWMFEAIQKQQQSVDPDRPSKRASRFISANAFAKETTLGLSRRPSSVPPSPRPISLLSTSISPNISTHTQLLASSSFLITDDTDFDADILALKRSGTEASLRRPSSRKALRTRWDDSRHTQLTSVGTGKSETVDPESSTQSGEQIGFWQLIREIYPTIPYKPIILLGLVICVLNGAMTPVFSFLLSRLTFEVSIGAQNTSTINMYGGIILGIAAFDGLLLGLKYFIMETMAMSWATRIRDICYKLIISQDKKWFDKSDNSPVRLVQILIKDGDDARALIGTVLPQCFLVGSMFSVGLIWALVQGWQLTLVGIVIAPIFALTMAVQSKLVSKCELRNKRARESVAKNYYEVLHCATSLVSGYLQHLWQAISNIRSIRSMAFEHVFQKEFDKSADLALSMGMRGACIEGCSLGVASAFIYLAEALLFYVGALLIASGTYTYLQMIEVLDLVVFTVTVGSQLMAFSVLIVIYLD